MAEKVTLTLSRDESLIFHNWLVNFIARTRGGENFEDQAEQRVLWDIEVMLEDKLDELLRTEYRELLEAAWARVRDSTE